MIASRHLRPRRRKAALGLSVAALAPAALAGGTNTLSLGAELPDAGLSAMRALGALLLVLSLFLGGVWLYRNSLRAGWRKTGLPKLAVLETRALGNRHALYVVGYEQQRLLIGGSPAGLSLLSQLPAAPAPAETAPAPAPQPASFAQCLGQLWFRDRPGAKTEGAGS
jgi:flagellar biogenesis protein FliO